MEKQDYPKSLALLVRISWRAGSFVDICDRRHGIIYLIELAVGGSGFSVSSFFNAPSVITEQRSEPIWGIT